MKKPGFITQFVTLENHKSIISRVAFLAGEKLECYREESEYDFSHRKSLVMYEEFFNMASGNPTCNRETFWNRIDLAKFFNYKLIYNPVLDFKHKKKVKCAFEFNIDFLSAYSDKANIILAKEFVREGFVAKGVPVDLFCHYGNEDPQQPVAHFHVLVPMRKLISTDNNSKRIHWGNPFAVRKFYKLWLRMIQV